jgi:mycothiol synthase
MLKGAVSMTFQLRPMTVEDYPAIVEIVNQFHVRVVTVEEMHHWDRMRKPDWPLFRLVAEVDGRVVGSVNSNSNPSMVPGDLNVDVKVHREYHGRGIGTALWEAVQPFIRQQQPKRLRSWVLDNQPDALRWAERRGFVKVHHIFNSELDVAAFDPSPFEGKIEEVMERGFRFVHFDTIRSPETERSLYDRWTEYISDVPDAADRPPMDYEQWRHRILESPETWPQGVIIALDREGNWAGLTAMTRHPDTPNRAHIAMTGVGRQYRGQGLALALKLYATLFLKEQRVERVLTNNHSANQPMLAVNRKLGYVPMPGSYTLFKYLP